MLSPKYIFSAALVLTIALAANTQTTTACTCVESSVRKMNKTITGSSACSKRGLTPSCFLSSGGKAPRPSQSSWSIRITTSSAAQPAVTSTSSSSILPTSSSATATATSSTRTSSSSATATSSMRTSTSSTSRFLSTSSTSPASTGPPAIVQSVGDYDYIGCYTEASTGRALSDSSTSSTTAMTVEYCANYCVGSKYFGVQYAQECFCGNTLNSRLASGSTPSTNGCSMVCKGNSSQYCGGSFRLNVYETKASPSTSSFSNATTGVPTPNTGKRGLSFENANLTQFWSLAGQNSKVSWAYNWYSAMYNPRQAKTGFNPALQFVPVLWSTAPDLTNVWPENAAAAIAAGSDALLAFNEPDQCGGGGACMSLASTLDGYKKFMNPLTGKARLGGPAITNGGAPAGLTFLQNFMGNCSDCTVDFVPIHWYADASAVSYFKSFVQQAYVVGGYRPLWITEFACSTGTDAEKENFLKAVLPWLDAQTYVERYAYFGDFQGILINENGTGLSGLGEIYNNY